LTGVITAAKKLHYNTIIKKSNNKTKTTWNIVKTITNNRGPTNNITMMKINDKLSSNPIDIVDAFNHYFLSIAEKLLNNNSCCYSSLNNKDILFYLHQNCCHSFPKLNFSNMNTNKIKKIILAIKPKNSHGYDEISLKVIKSSASYILSPLTYICNNILLTGIFPDRLKFSEVKPPYKKCGDLPQQIKGLVKPILFADDTSFIISNVDPQLMFHEVKVIVDIIQNWFNSNKMLLNYKKTELMQWFPNMSHERMDFIKHNANKISTVNSIEFLGE
jgi:hypothetical protein